MANSKMLKPLDDICSCCENDDPRGFLDYACKTTMSDLQSKLVRAKKDLKLAVKRKEKVEQELKRKEEDNELDNSTNQEIKSPDGPEDTTDKVSKNLVNSDDLGTCDCSNDDDSDSVKNENTSTTHKFKTTTSAIGENCVICDVRIQCNLHAQKCISCKAKVHEKCSNQLTKPCEPAVKTERSLSVLEDYRLWSKRLIGKSEFTQRNKQVCVLHRIPRKEKVEGK